MCGFVGFMNQTDNRDENLATVKAMADRIAHRGPDQDDYYVDDDISLGFRRLSIIDLEGGSQPITNEDGTKVLLFNGEIYNYQDFRKELLDLGHKFKTEADSEVLLHGYEEWGDSFLVKLRGMFAFVIWDRERKELFGARDIFGIKPFFYYARDGKLLICSEIKALLANDQFEKEFNEERLPEYLCFEYLPTDETLFRYVFKLPPGSFFRYHDGHMDIQQYFVPKFDIDDEKDAEYWGRIIEETFRDSIKAHSIADVEVGCFLSAGVDSSFVAHEIAKSHKAKTFTVGYDEGEYSELDYAKEFAETEGLSNYQYRVTADEFFEKTPEIQYHMDEPLPNPSAIPLYFLTRMAAEHVKVVLSGEGADELFGGYHYYREPLEFEKYMKLPKGIRRLNSAVASRLPAFHGKRFLVRGRHPIEQRFIRNNYVFDHSEVDSILKKPSGSKDPSFYTKRFFDECKDLDDISRMQYVDIRTWLVQDILVKADRMSMANSLELRVPFLDKEMLKTALKIPSNCRITPETTKYCLRLAAKDSLPEKTSTMKKKGFMTPLNDWLRQDKYHDIVKTAFNGDTAARFFNIKKINKLLEDHRTGRAKNMKRIWSLYCFIVWYDQYFA